MLIAKVEGKRFCFEVVQSVEGYTVRPFDLETGDTPDGAEKMFRTAPAAFAYAELAASSDRLACGDLPDEDITALHDCAQRFDRLRRDLGDDGVAGELIGAWERAAVSERNRQFH